MLHDSSDDASAGTSRRSFLQRSAALTAAGAAAAVVTSQKADAQYSSPNILPTIYPGWNMRNFAQIRKHEQDHVNVLLNLLGGHGFGDPGFQNLEQPTAQAFARLSQVFENTGVATYNGAAPLIFDHGNLAAAASIALIEARHAGFLNVLLNAPIAGSVVVGLSNDESFDSSQTPIKTAQSIAPFLRNPNLGFQLASAIQTTPSPENDIAIFRFALALEYLERDFYNLNVPKFLHVM